MRQVKPIILNNFASMFALVLIIGLVGCAPIPKSTDNSEKTPLKLSMIKRDDAGRYFRDLVAKFAIGNTQGSTGLVDLGDNNSLYVSVGDDYVAATGEACRSVILARGAEISIHSSVCNINGVWETVYFP